MLLSTTSTLARNAISDSTPEEGIVPEVCSVRRKNNASTTRRRRHLVCMLMALAVAPATSLPAAETAAVAPPNVTEVKTLDEVVVTGNLESLSAARNAVLAAEDRFYARYNKLNKDSRFDVHCRQQTPSDHVSRFTTRVCDPGYVDDATQIEALKMFPSNGLQKGDVFVSLASAVLFRQAGLPELQRRTLELIRSDPELLRALLERARLQEHYDTLRQKKFKGRTIVSD